jgi:Quercetinase C-terminal cupin domain
MVFSPFHSIPPSRSSSIIIFPTRSVSKTSSNDRVKPGKSGLKPTYYTRHHPSESKRDTLVPIIAPASTLPPTAPVPEKEGTTELIPINQDLRFFASILSPGKSVEYTFQDAGERLGYIHLAQMSGYNPGEETGGAKVDVGGKEIREGDGLFVRGAKKGDRVVFENKGDVDAEFVWFEMGQNGGANLK